MAIDKTPETLSDLYPSPWLKAIDLQGRAVTVRIEAVDIQSFRQVDGTQAQKPVVAFHGKGKKLICNKTQSRAIAAVTGSERFSDWPGARLQLAPAMTEGHKMTIAISRAPDPE